MRGILEASIWVLMGHNPIPLISWLQGNELFQIELLCVVTLESLTCFYMLKIYISAQRM
jgi:hypothetical protein